MKNLDDTMLDTPLAQDQGPGRNLPGTICLANAARFTEAHFSQPLTTFAGGAVDREPLRDLLDQICGRAIPVGRRFEYAEYTRAEEFLSDTDAKRAIGAAFKRVERTSTKTNGATDNYGLTMVVDKDEVDELGANWQEQRVQMLIRRLLRGSVRKAVTLLSAAANNTAKTWDTTAGKDPDQDVLSELIAAADITGIAPTTALYGQTAWNKRGLAHRAQNTAGGFASAMLTPEALAGILGVDRVVKTGARYQSAAAAKTQIVANLVLLYMASDEQSTDDPSNIKRFVSNGGDFKVYIEEHTKSFEISVETYELIKIISTLGIRQFTIS